MTEKEQIKAKIHQNLNNGETTIDELKHLVKLFERDYKKSGKSELLLIEWQAFYELLRRLRSSVFADSGQNYPEGYKKECIYAEYHNTVIIIDLIKELIKTGKEHGDITSPQFYGQPDSEYKVSLENLIHILLRHNNTINSFINPDSKKNGYNPSSFTFGAFADPMLKLFMTLNVITDSDWKKSIRGNNLICNIKITDQKYTIVRKGHSKEILSFYPRNDDHDSEYLKLERISDKMKFKKK